MPQLAILHIHVGDGQMLLNSPLRTVHEIDARIWTAKTGSYFMHCPKRFLHGVLLFSVAHDVWCVCTYSRLNSISG